jgi:Na+-transporting methylmalonyl-CoA/oxaloacetate decarboxylase gamma subunit
MNEFTLKIILSLLGGIVFAFIFILMAFALPIEKTEKIIIKKPQGKLEKISHTLKH